MKNMVGKMARELEGPSGHSSGGDMGQEWHSAALSSKRKVFLKPPASCSALFFCTGMRWLGAKAQMAHASPWVEASNCTV